MIVLVLICAVAASIQAARGGVVESGPVGLVLPVAGAPLSAEQVEERTRTMLDGKSVSEALVSRVYRDRAGRMMIEWRVESSHGESAGIAYLLDPVAKYSYMVLIEAKIAARIGGPESGEVRVGLPAVGQPLPDREWQTKTDQLGARVIHGIAVEGSQTIRNSEDEPAQSAVSEVWLSQSLHLTMFVRASGPGWTHTASLQDIDHHEPDPKLFVVPPDYRIQD